MGTRLYMMKSLQCLTFCKMRYFRILVQCNICESQFQSSNASLVSSLRKKGFHESRIHFNQNASASLKQLQRHSMNEDEKLVKSMEYMFPFPRNSLKNFYHLSSQNLQMNYKFECEFEKCGLQHDPMYVCTLLLKGPVHAVFQGYGRNKKVAETAASLKAIVALCKGKHMDAKGRPPEVLDSSKQQNMSRSEIGGQLYNPIPISLTDSDLLAAERLVNDYDNNIAPIIQSSAVEYDSEDVEQISDSASENEDILFNLMTGKRIFEMEETNNERNIKLLIQSNKLQQQKNYTLPIYSVRDEILESVENNSVTIIKGGTGCGKSTQVPQIIMNKWAEDMRGSECNIVVAQPKRIATYNVARRIAVERGEHIGQSVGYKMRLEAKMLKHNGGFMFYTCGTLREMLRLNPLLVGVTYIIIDEIHERSIDTDLLLLLLKKALKRGSKMKMILMSATSRIDELTTYFDTSAVVSVPSGTLYPVESHYMTEISTMLGEFDKKWETPLKTPAVNYKMIVDIIRYIHSNKPEGAVLVFLPGWQDIKMILDNLRGNDELCVMPLHSRLPARYHNQIFVETNDGKRKIILATNIAETSITIADVVYVIDSGLQNDSRYDPSRNISSFGTYWISKANVIQRKGRTGRVQPGEVYCLYDEATYLQMEDYPKPDILKLPLETVVLKCKAFFEDMSIRGLLNDLINPPHAVAIEKAIEMLSHIQLMKSEMGAVNERLTPLGRTLATFSTNPFFSKPLVYSALLRCGDPALNFMCLENKLQDIFKNPVSNSDMRYLKEEYHQESDILAVAGILNHAFEIFERQRTSESGAFDPQNDREEMTISLRNDLNSTCEKGEDVALICPQRLQNFHRIRNLFQNQVNNCLPRVDRNLDSAMNENVDFEQGSSSEVASNSELILASFLSAASFIIKRLQDERRNTSVLALENSSKVVLHSGSVLTGRHFEDDEKDYFFSMDVFHSQERNVSVVRDLSSVPALSIALFYGEELEILSCEGDVDPILTLGIKNRNVIFKMDERTSKCVICLRKMWNNIVDYYMEPSTSLSSTDSLEESEVVWQFCSEYRKLLSQLLKEKEDIAIES